MLYFFLLTDGFQFVPEQIMLFGLNYYGKDYALIFTIVVFLSYLITGRITAYKKDNVRVWIYLFYVFLFIAIVVDLQRNPSIVGFLLMVRQYFHLLIFFILPDIPLPLFYRLGRSLFKLTIFQTILFMSQMVTGVRLLTMGGLSESYEPGFLWYRPTNLPYFIYIFLFITLLLPKEKLKYKNQLLILFVLAILLTLTRTLILGLFITVFVAMLAGLLKAGKKVIPVFVFIALCALPIIGARVMSSFSDLGGGFSSNFEKPDDNNLTFTWRMALTAERAAYVSNDTKSRIFGIGFIHEKDFGGQPFIVGHLNEEGEPVQLDQGDIAWPNLFLRLGFVGTFFYVMLAISLGIYYYKNREDTYAAAAFLFLIYATIITFASGMFSFADFFVIPYFIYYFIRKRKTWEKITV